MPINILIVDDSASTRQVIERTIRIAEPDIGECHHAGNGREALEILRHKWVDMVITDLHMPEMDGRQLVHHIRKVEMLRALPIAIVTSERSDQTEIEMNEIGATTYHKKPLTPEMLKQIFETLKARMP